LFNFLIFISCSQAPPQVFEDRWVLIDRADIQGNKLFEELAFYLHAQDDDGPEDIATMKMVLIENDYTWQISGEQLQQVKVQNEYWYGSHSFIMPAGSSFPEGSYNVELHDQSGAFTTYQWFLSRSDKTLAFLDPPRITRSSGTIRIEDKKNRPWMLQCYRNGQSVLQKYMKSGVDWPFPENLNTPDIELFILYIDPLTLRGWKLGPF